MLEVQTMKSKDMKENILRDVSTSFWLRDAIDHVDNLNSRDPVDVSSDLMMLSRYIDKILSEKRADLNTKSGFVTGFGVRP